MTSTAKTDFEQKAAAWMGWLRVCGRSPKTIATYYAALLSLDRFLQSRGSVAVSRIKLCDLEAWQLVLLKNECTPSTREQFARTVSYWFGWLKQQGLIFSNPAVALKKPKLPRLLGRCPTEAQMAKICRGLAGRRPRVLRDRALLEIAYSTGARREEVTRLRVDSVNLQLGLIRLHGKGDRERMVPLTRLAVLACARYLGGARAQLLGRRTDHGALFISERSGTPLGYAGVGAVIASAGRRAGIKITMQEIRRAFATHLFRGGAHITPIKELLGHVSYRHLRHYLVLPADRLALQRKLKSTP